MGRRFLSTKKRLLLLGATLAAGIAAATAYAALPSTTVDPSSVALGTLVGQTPLNVLDASSFAKVAASGTNAVLQRTHFDAGQSTGWHTHPGPNIVLVVSGKAELFDQNCNVTFYSAGQGFATGLDVHEFIALTSSEFYALYFLPANASVLRNDAAPPACATAQGEDTPFLPAGVPVLHVHINPQGFGSVRSSSPLGYLIDCPLACQRPVGTGTTVTLTANPNSGWAFDKWSGGPCDGQPATCSFTMPSAATTEVYANFKKS